MVWYFYRTQERLLTNIIMKNQNQAASGLKKIQIQIKK